MRISKKEKQYLEARADNIREMIKEDPERHPMAIIATTGQTFHEDLRKLYDYCLEEKQIDICNILTKNTNKTIYEN